MEKKNCHWNTDTLFLVSFFYLGSHGRERERERERGGGGGGVGWVGGRGVKRTFYSKISFRFQESAFARREFNQVEQK